MKRSKSSARLTLRPEEAAKLAGCGPASIRKGIKAGEIPHVMFGRKIVIPREAFVAWLNRGNGLERRRA